MNKKEIEKRKKTGTYFQLGLNIGIWVLYILWLLFLSSTELTMSNFLLHCIFLSIIVILNFDYLKRCYKSFKKNEKNTKLIFLSVLALFGILFLSNILISALVNSLNIIDQATKTIKDLFYNFPMGTLFAFFLTSVFYPVVEELIFRKSLRDAIKSPFVFVIISSIIAWYFQVTLNAPALSEFILTLNAFLNGVFMSILYIKKKDNILYTIIPRMIFNIIISIINIIGVFALVM